MFTRLYLMRPGPPAGLGLSAAFASDGTKNISKTAMAESNRRTLANVSSGSDRTGVPMAATRRMKPAPLRASSCA
jgi:hypothetical protein